MKVIRWPQVDGMTLLEFDYWLARPLPSKIQGKPHYKWVNFGYYQRAGIRPAIS